MLSKESEKEKEHFSYFNKKKKLEKTRKN